MTAGKAQRQRGAALIEALVALLVLSVGLLGLVGLQTASVKYQQNSWARSAIATQIADLSDRIRSNPGAADTAYVYTPASYTAERTTMAGTSAFTVSPDCGSATCTPAQLASYDVTKWRRSLNASIPGAVGYITGARNTAYGVTIAWLDKNRTDSSLTSLEAAPLCSTQTAAAALRSCCPDALFPSGAVPGVRCVNFSLIP